MFEIAVLLLIAALVLAFVPGLRTQPNIVTFVAALAVAFALLYIVTRFL